MQQGASRRWQEVVLIRRISNVECRSSALQLDTFHAVTAGRPRGEQASLGGAAQVGRIHLDTFLESLGVDFRAFGQLQHFHGDSWQAVEVSRPRDKVGQIRAILTERGHRR